MKWFKVSALAVLLGFVLAGCGTAARTIALKSQSERTDVFKEVSEAGVAMAIAPPEPTPVPAGVPKTGFMTVKMAKTAAATIASDVTGKTPPLADELDVVCLMDMGKTAALMKAYPVLPPRQSTYLKKAIWAKWLKVRFEKYFLWKMKRGLSGLP